MNSFNIKQLNDCSVLSEFSCGLEMMDKFIHSHLQSAIYYNYCKGYIITTSDNNIIGLFALNCDSLVLDIDDKDEIVNSSNPISNYEYSEIFYNKRHYPAIEISYIAISEKYQKKHIGTKVIETIIEKAKSFEFAGCQFITVEAYKSNAYSSIDFYSKCKFQPCEYLNPNKNTLRMFRMLY